MIRLIEATVESIETAMEVIAKTRMHAATTMAPAATLRKDGEADQKRDAYN